MPMSYKKYSRATKSVLYGSPSRKDSVGMEPPFREDLIAEADESPPGTAGEDTAGCYDP
jgi:hypothetical protein